MTKFSIIISTINRVGELNLLFESLIRQTYKDFEVIIVDQNTDERLIPVVERYSSSVNITHINSQSRGASRGRNIGIVNSQGEIAIFPDDDCVYPPDLLELSVLSFGKNQGARCLIGMLIDPQGKPHSRWYPEKTTLATNLSALVIGFEPVLIIQRSLINKLEGFDETIGIGSQTPWGSGEGSDMCIRALQLNEILLIDPSLKIIHPRPPLLSNYRSQNEKTYSYAVGMGGVIKKNRLSFFTIVLYLFTYIRSILWACVKLRKNQAQFHLFRLKGVIEGLVKYQ